MIHVVNKRTHAATPQDVYVGRSGFYPSPLSNPYTDKVLSKTNALYQVDTIEEALRSYDLWLTGKMLSGDDVVTAELERIAELARVGDVYLVCHCVNNRNRRLCHAFSIKAAVERIIADS